MDGKNLFLWIVIFTLWFNTHWCSSECDIKKIRRDPFSYSYWGERHAEDKFVKSTYAPTIEFWIRSQSNFNYFLIKTEDTDERLKISNNQFKFEENVWTRVSFKSWYSVQSSEDRCMSAAIVKDEYVVKQVLKCPKNLESLNFIVRKEIYVDGGADFSFDCDPNNAPVIISPTTPHSAAVSDSVSIPTYSQMATVLVLLSIVALIFLSILVHLIFKKNRFKMSMKKTDPEGMLMSERTITSVENNYEEIQIPEPGKPTAPNVEESQPSFKSKSDLEF